MNAEEFEKKVGRPPKNDDLERVNCDQAGAAGHYQCGWCLEHDKPRFECGCIGKKEPRVTITGALNTGKTTMAVLIEQMLYNLGIRTKVKDIDLPEGHPRTGHQKRLLLDRIHETKGKFGTILIEVVQTARRPHKGHPYAMSQKKIAKIAEEVFGEMSFGDQVRDLIVRGYNDAEILTYYGIEESDNAELLVSRIRVLERDWLERREMQGVMYCRGDVESVAKRELTDEEWARVQESPYWRKALPDVLCQRGWEIIDSALMDAGIEKGEDLEEDELPPGVEAVCENCGKPCDYDSEMCLCPDCDPENENNEKEGDSEG